MFHNCVNIISIDLSSFDASCATDISHMFYLCENLKEINFTSFCTQNVIVFFYGTLYFFDIILIS